MSGVVSRSGDGAETELRLRNPVVGYRCPGCGATFYLDDYDQKESALIDAWGHMVDHPVSVETLESICGPIDQEERQ